MARCRHRCETWPITNAASGSFDEAAVGRVADTLGVTRQLIVPDDDLADANAAAAAERTVLLTGVGTVSAAVDALEGWAGALLVLPGGTINLLARKASRRENRR